MDHPVVMLAAERAREAGVLALRFDFRGVRGSDGDVEDAAGHLEDVRRGARELRRLLPAGPLLGGGFSYGARMLARALVHPNPPSLEALLLLAPATRVPRTSRDFGNLLLGRPLAEAARDDEAFRALASLTVPVACLVGENDVVAPPAELEAALPAQGRLEVLRGLNHFFSPGPGAGRTAERALAGSLDRAWASLLGQVRRRLR
jgi:alpha/beta superfamily hydrolase